MSFYIILDKNLNLKRNLIFIQRYASVISYSLLYNN